MKKIIRVMLAGAMVASLAACGGKNTAPPAPETKAAETAAAETKAEDTKAADTKAESGSENAETADFHIGIVTGSVSQSEDDRRGACLLYTSRYEKGEVSPVRIY